MLGNVYITIGLPLCLFVIMVGMGLSLNIKDFYRVRQKPKVVLLGILLQIVGVPLLGFAIGGISGGGLLAVGVVLISVMPEGTTSNLFTYLAKGNLALSITLTVLTSVLAVLTIPFYMNFALTLFLGKSVSLQLPVFKTLLTMGSIVILPVCIGMFTRVKKPNLSLRLEPIINKFAVILLIVMIVLILVSEWKNLSIWLAKAWAPVLALNLAAVALGVVGGKISGFKLQDILTIGIGLCIKNTTLGLTIALSLFQSAELALPVAVYALLMYGTGGLLCWCGRRLP